MTFKVRDGVPQGEIFGSGHDLARLSKDDRERAQAIQAKTQNGVRLSLSDYGAALRLRRAARKPAMTASLDDVARGIRELKEAMGARRNG